MPTVAVEEFDKGGYAVRLDDEVVTRTDTQEQADDYAKQLRAALNSKKGAQQ